MPDTLAQTRHELAVANRILGYEGVLDAFGHVSVRHPDDPGRYLLPRSRSPELIEPADILEFTLDSAPIEPPTAPMYSERVIHGEIYKARPDVMAVCHHHAPAVMPFCITGEPLVPVFHLGATIGATVPYWDSLDDFGDTNLLVVKPEEGASLARALGSHSMVLLRRHGATVVGASLHELVFRSVYSCLNAVYLSEGKKMGKVGMLTPGEIEMAGAINKIPSVPLRTWEYWARRLTRRGGMPPGASATARKGSSSRSTRGAQAAKQAAKRGRSKGRKKR
ncbi:MAG TPA: class II aldolase/adducin family protein [Xanthobacteraceae bacterium]